MKSTYIFLGNIAAVGLPGALIGWLTGFIGWHPVAAIVWGLFILDFRRRNLGKADAYTWFLAGMAGLAVYFVGQVTHS